MKHTYSVSPQFAVEVIRTAIRLGHKLNSDILLLESTFEAVDRVPLLEFCQALALIEKVSGDPDIGFHIGEKIEPSCFNIVGHLVMACNTVGEALSFVQRFQALVIDCADSSCHESEENIVFSWTPTERINTAEKVLIDLVLSSTRNFGIWATGISEAFTNVHFQYAKPRNTDACEKTFGHPGVYNCDHNSFSIPKVWSGKPIRSASENLMPVIYNHAENNLKSLQNFGGFISHLIEILSNQMLNGNPSIEWAAEELNISPRTLQRHLNNHATNFSDVLQGVRLEKANYLLRNTDLPITEIANRIGYKEQSSFSSAYKSWVGASPKEIRATSTNSTNSDDATA